MDSKVSQLLWLAGAIVDQPTNDGQANLSDARTEAARMVRGLL